MELFNKYKNKDFIYLTNYINNCVNDNSLSSTPEELSNLLLGSSQNTFEEFINALLNKNSNGLDPKAPNADLLYQDNTSHVLPIRENYIPIRPSIAEKAWLYYILKDTKAELFIDKEKISELLAILEADLTLPNISDCIDIRNLTTAPIENSYTADTIQAFRDIVYAIYNHKELIVTNTTFDGQIFENQVIRPYKLEYSPQFDSFSLSAYPTDTKRPVKMNLTNLSNVSIGADISDYDDFILEFEKKLVELRVKEPITIEIQNYKNGYDRCSYKFASFDKICYENENNYLIMNIYYYRFQKDEILRNLLFLGPTTKIISPPDIKNEFVELVKNSLHIYEAE